MSSFEHPRNTSRKRGVVTNRSDAHYNSNRLQYTDDTDPRASLTHWAGMLRPHLYFALPTQPTNANRTNAGWS
jgi:hypothetical protein